MSAPSSLPVAAVPGASSGPAVLLVTPWSSGDVRLPAEADRLPGTAVPGASPVPSPRSDAAALPAPLA